MILKLSPLNNTERSLSHSAEARLDLNTHTHSENLPFLELEDTSDNLKDNSDIGFIGNEDHRPASDEQHGHIDTLSDLVNYI